MKKVFVHLVLILLSTNVFTQKWTFIEKDKVSTLSNQAKKTVALKSKTYLLDYSQLVENIKAKEQRSTQTVLIPSPNNEMIAFTVHEEKIMESELARKYPDLRAYAGFDNTGNYRIRMDIGANGLNAVITSDKEGMMFVSPLFFNNTNIYQSYYLKDAPDTEKTLACGTATFSPNIKHDNYSISNLRSSTVKRHEYRYAVTCTGEWAMARGTKEKALADIITSVNTLNSIFEIELGMKLILIDRNDELIFLDPAIDPFTSPEEGRLLLPNNTSIINNIVGAASYDLGHIYTNRCTDVGGVAYLNAICTVRKGGGVTCFSGTNFARTITGTLAHEIGHQLGANHTWNYCGTSADQVRIGNNFEPGSGSTIMSYGGSCGPDNVTTTRDPYYHNASLTEMNNVIRNLNGIGFACANKINTDNIPPTITKMPAKDQIIPIRTPFILDGEAKDENNDKLTYCWEQKDLTTIRTGLLTVPLGADQIPLRQFPSFRTFSPINESYRIIPTPSFLLLNSSKDTLSKTEFLPVFDRDMNFSLTVRDNHPQASATSWALTSVKATEKSGPFLVTSQDKFTSIKSDTFINVTWDVAGTDLDPINCKLVDIYLSQDRKLYPGDPKVIPLVLGTPNDGNEFLSLPSLNVTLARIIVKASNNVFFNINRSYFSIVKSDRSRAYFETSSFEKDICVPNNKEITLKSRGTNAYKGAVKYEIINKHNGVKVELEKTNTLVGDSTKLKIAFDQSATNGRYEILVRSIGENQDTFIKNIIFDINVNNFDGVAISNPLSGIKTAGPDPDFQWKTSKNVTFYQFQVATSPTFSKESIFFQDTTSKSSIKMKTSLKNNTIYYARVIGNNGCFTQKNAPIISFGSSFADCETYNFGDLPFTFPGDSKRTLETMIDIKKDMEIASLSIPELKITHNNFSDLKVMLKSPLDSTITIIDNICPYYVELNAAFKDDFLKKITCATIEQKQFQPSQPLSRLKKGKSKGNWKLIVEDTENFNGGTVVSASLELCSNLVFAHPTISTLSKLPAQYLLLVNISSQVLSSQSEKSSPAELVYTITNQPLFGKILLNNVPLNVGNKFSQKDINEGLVRYLNEGPKTVLNNSFFLDSLGIVLQNNAGGFDGIKFLPIEVEVKTTSTTDIDLQKEHLIIYPNPANDKIGLNIPDHYQGEVKVQIKDLTGKLMIEKTIAIDAQIDISSFKSGMYLLSANFDGRKAFGKFLKL